MSVEPAVVVIDGLPAMLNCSHELEIAKRILHLLAFLVPRSWW
jgi:hypothetical protein